MKGFCFVLLERDNIAHNNVKLFWMESSKMTSLYTFIAWYITMTHVDADLLVETVPDMGSRASRGRESPSSRDLVTPVVSLWRESRDVSDSLRGRLFGVECMYV